MSETVISATIEPHGRRERRGFQRRAIGRDSTFRDARAVPMDVMVQDLSRTGAQLVTPVDLPVGARVSIGLPGIGTRAATIVRLGTSRLGCAFDRPLDEQELEAAFRPNPVIQGGFRRTSNIYTAPFPDPVIARWHPAIRFTIVTGLAAGLWIAIVRLL